MFEIAGGILLAILILGIIVSAGEIDLGIGKLIYCFVIATVIVVAVWYWEATLIGAIIIAPIVYFGQRSMKDREQKKKIFEATSITLNLTEIKNLSGKLLLDGESDKRGNRRRELHLNNRVSIVIQLEAKSLRYDLIIKMRSPTKQIQFEHESYGQRGLDWVPDSLSIDEMLFLDQELKEFVQTKLSDLERQTENSNNKDINFFEDAKILLKSPKIVMYQHLIPQDGVDVSEAVMCNEKIFLEAVPDLDNLLMQIYKEGKKIGQIHLKKWDEIRKRRKIDLVNKFT